MTCTYTHRSVPTTNVFCHLLWEGTGDTRTNKPQTLSQDADVLMRKELHRNHSWCIMMVKTLSLQPDVHSVCGVAEAGLSVGWATWCTGEHLSVEGSSQENCPRCQEWHGSPEPRTTALGCFFNTNGVTINCSSVCFSAPHYMQGISLQQRHSYGALCTLS